GLLCETAQRHPLGEGFAIGVFEARFFVFATNGQLWGTTQPWFAVQTAFTFATELHQAGRYVVAHRKFGHVWANGSHYPGNFVTQHCWRRILYFLAHLHLI